MSDRLRLEKLPKIFTVVSQNDLGEEAIVHYKKIMPPLGVMARLFRITGARGICVLTHDTLPQGPEKGMKFFLSTNRDHPGESYEM